MRRPKTPFKNANAKPTDPNSPEDRTPFLMSMTQLAKLIGRDQDTLTSWIKKHDCPVHTRGNGQGEATLLDPRDVFRWRESFCRKEEIAKFQPAANPADPNGIPMPSKTTAVMIKLEQLNQQQIKTALSLEQVVLKSAAIQTYEAAVGILRTSMMGVPERLVREMAGLPRKTFRGKPSRTKHARLRFRRGSRVSRATRKSMSIRGRRAWTQGSFARLCSPPLLCMAQHAPKCMCIGGKNAAGQTSALRRVT